uniref:Uncharacterized protein n=1 Tax=Fagus sylvatica TaxID=28930 RepID=A0A2N9IX74_FAGSY
MFDQKNGHLTDECFHLKNDIQDLIDRDIIPKPNVPTMPNIHQNPLPNYQRVLPPNQLNYIEDEEFIFAIDDKGKGIAKPDEEKDRVLTQLKRTQDTISISGLLIASQKHRDSILGALAEKEVLMITSPKEGLSIMGVENTGVVIFFIDKDLPLDGARHNRALYITVECLNAKVPRVLVNNGSTLNVCPLKTATTFGHYGRPTLPFDYNLLLGRVWMCSLGIVPSTLHQKLKLPWKDGILTILGDEEISTNVCNLKNSPKDEDHRGFEFFQTLKWVEKKVKEEKGAKVETTMVIEPRVAMLMERWGIPLEWIWGSLAKE